MTEKNEPPAHLSDEARTWWVKLTSEFDISDQAGLLILQTALESFDLMRAAQATVASEGATLRDRFGQVKVNPACNVERDARSQLLLALKNLNLDFVGALRDGPGRPTEFERSAGGPR